MLDSISHPSRGCRAWRAAPARGSEQRQVPAHGGIQAVIQRFADQRVADRHLQHIRHVGQEVAQVVLRQIVASVDAQADGLRSTCGSGEQRQHRLGGAGGVCLSVGAGVQLDAVCADFSCLLQQWVAGVDEQADPATPCIQFGDQRAQALAVPLEVEAMVGRDLAVAVGHQGGLPRVAERTDCLRC
ncbi:hypothetical protein G6F40_014521 [Rhizopus arrhizus]|nr:hypothetical protein G6F40_014521 [Rhizopus arrhizus]